MDSSSMGAGLMLVFAVSGSVLLVAHQVHKRLLSDFMKKIESELLGGTCKDHPKKKVRFADDVVEPLTDNKEYRKKKMKKSYLSKAAAAAHGGGSTAGDQKFMDTMPLNRQALYKGIMAYKVLGGHNISSR